MLSFWNLVNYLRDCDWEMKALDIYFPFYVNEGGKILMSDRTTFVFKETKSFETLDELIDYIKKHK